MKHSLKFEKYSGNGNDFIILDHFPFFSPSFSQAAFIRKLCHRRFGIGADGVIICKTHQTNSLDKTFDATMRIFNSDGSEAEMCGNGLRCLATYLASWRAKNNLDFKDEFYIKTMNGIYRSFLREGEFFVEMSEVYDKNLYDLSMFDEFERTFYVNTGVPHLIFLAQEIDRLDLASSSPRYRYHSLFPSGVNVNYIELDNFRDGNDDIFKEKKSDNQQKVYVRTYERGVEDETYSCGTGLTACALALNEWFGWRGDIHLRTMGGDHLIELHDDKIFYSGKVVHSFSGVYNLSDDEISFIEKKNNDL